MTTRNALALVLTAVVGSMLTVGCATKKFVRESVSPVQQRVGDLEKKTSDQGTSIADLEKNVSRVDERAQGADSRAAAAGREAARANEQAALANKEVAEARAAAAKGIAQAEASMGRRLENVNNYKLAFSESVLFELNNGDLDEEAQQVLDALAAKLGSMRHYTIEVQGFTDSTGDPQANLELSRRRAQSVVRYLTLQHKVPLHSIQTMGYGEESPSADNKTRDGRKQNRRVEVRVFSYDLGA